MTTAAVVLGVVFGVGYFAVMAMSGRGADASGAEDPGKGVARPGDGAERRPRRPGGSRRRHGGF